eukprot:GGOE01008411.1.p1 GENE.GGOE01008411.1~~GGOE01008411.1.p1  ORF type:complete len:471 (-),score=131.94 GGOE01008411.1:400-1749(-)
MGEAEQTAVDDHASDNGSAPSSVSPRHSLLSALRRPPATSFMVEVDAVKGITTAQDLPSLDSVLEQVRALCMLHSLPAEVAQPLTNQPSLPRGMHFQLDGGMQFPSTRSSFCELDIFDLDALRDSSLDAASAGFTWVNVQTPSSKHIARIGQACRLHPLTIDDITHDAFEKTELFLRRGYMYCMINAEDAASTEGHLHVCLFRGWVLTIHTHPSSTIQHTLDRLEDEFSLVGRSSSDLQGGQRSIAHASWIPYTVADLDVDWMLAMAQMLVQEAQETDQLVLRASSREQSDVLRRVSLARSRIYTQLQRNFSKQRLLMALSSPASESFVAPQMKLYLRDVYDHIQCCGQRLSFAQEVLSQTSSDYVACISIEEAQLSNRTNVLLGRLTLLTVPPMVFNLVAALFGLNVPVPMQNVTGLAPFCAIVFTGIVFCVTSFLVLARLDEQQQKG